MIIIHVSSHFWENECRNASSSGGTLQAAGLMTAGGLSSGMGRTVHVAIWCGVYNILYSSNF